MPDGLEKIGSHWFRDCGVESVTIPASVRRIGEDAFYKCTNLREVLL